MLDRPGAGAAPPPLAIHSAPHMPEALMARTWTLYFSRAAPAALTVVQNDTKTAYTDESIPIFRTRLLSSFFSGWNTARTHIANVAGNYDIPLRLNADFETGRLGLEQMREGLSVHLFADDVRPVWEDSRCKKGGRIMLAGDSAEVSFQLRELG